MTTRDFMILVACSALLLGAVGCKPQSSALPLTLQAVSQFDPTNTAQISFEERGGEIFVSVIDKYGGCHIHKLICEGTPKQQALELLEQKHAELETRR